MFVDGSANAADCRGAQYWARARRALAVALLLLCCASLDVAADALAGRGGGYQNQFHHQRTAIDTQFRSLDELLTLSAAQKIQVRAILRRTHKDDRQAAAQIGALLTERQRKIYARAPQAMRQFACDRDTGRCKLRGASVGRFDL